MSGRAAAADPTIRTPVAAVAGLVEGVGGEADEGLGGHQLVDRPPARGRGRRGRRGAGCACRRGSGGPRSGWGVRPSRIAPLTRRVRARRRRTRPLPCPEVTSRPGATGGPHEATLRSNALLVVSVVRGPSGGTNSRPVRRRRSGGSPLGGPASYRPSGRAPPGSHVDHACDGPPPFPGATRYTRRVKHAPRRSFGRDLGRERRPAGAHRADRPQVGELGLDDRVHLLRQVGLAGRGGPLEDVVDRLGAADHHRRPRVGRRAVDRHALALEVLELEAEDPADVVGRERRGDEVGHVLHDPVERLVDVEHRGRRVGWSRPASRTTNAAATTTTNPTIRNPTTSPISHGGRQDRSRP